MTMKARVLAAAAGLALICASPAFAQSVTEVPAPSEDLTRLQSRVDQLESLLRDATNNFERLQIENRRLKSDNERLQRMLDDAQRQTGAGDDQTTATPAVPPPPVASSVTPTRPAQTQAPQPQQFSAPKTGGVLGTLPAQDAQGDAAQAFRSAQRLLQQSNYVDAERALGQYLQIYGETPDAPEARYWRGRALTALHRYPDAAASFLDLLRKTPKSTRAPDGWVRLGIALFGMGKKDEACATFKDLPVRYPAADKSVSDLAKQKSQEFGCPR